MPTAMLAPNPSVGAAGRPQPQTPTGAAQGPWIRYARTATRPGYSQAGVAFGGGPLTTPLPSAPGYLRRLVFLNQASGGNGAVALTAVPADAPWNAWNPIQFKDPWGTPIITGDGYSLLFLAAKYSGQMGVLAAADRTAMPSWSPIVTTAGAGMGSYTFLSGIPVEGTKGYGVISVGNASVMPTLLAQPSPLSVVYGSNVFSVANPTMAATVDLEFYDVDPAMPVAPPGNGTTFQMVVVQGNQSVGSGSSTRVQMPRTGGYLTVLGLIFRDVNNARVDAWNSAGRVRLYVDGVPRFDDAFLELQDRMFEDFQTSRPTGVVAYNFKDSLGRIQLGLLDTLETAMQTNPGTLVEIEMTPWGTFTGPGQINALQIQVVPAGVIAQGLIEA